MSFEEGSNINFTEDWVSDLHTISSYTNTSHFLYGIKAVMLLREKQTNGYSKTHRALRITLPLGDLVGSAGSAGSAGHAKELRVPDESVAEG